MSVKSSTCENPKSKSLDLIKLLRRSRRFSTTSNILETDVLHTKLPQSMVSETSGNLGISSQNISSEKSASTLKEKCRNFDHELISQKKNFTSWDGNAGLSYERIKKSKKPIESKNCLKLGSSSVNFQSDIQKQVIDRKSSPYKQLAACKPTHWDILDELSGSIDIESVVNKNFKGNILSKITGIVTKFDQKEVNDSQKYAFHTAENISDTKINREHVLIFYAILLYIMLTPIYIRFGVE